MKTPKFNTPRVVACIALILGLSSLYIVDRSIRGASSDREAWFISAHFVAMCPLSEETPDDPPRTLSDLLKEYTDCEALMMKRFPQGLVYHPTNKGFVLDEPTPRYVSLFYRDRLVSTEKKWPRWEKSHKIATKFPGQQVPPGFE